ncbi:uroporphyrinogen-III C-methyltransferase [Halopseudomonas salegens]|uniref:Uroporphyrin-3 C-methyltransferase n=1 Tax=Halopseudomonas salegens TaxID=1434072 RepID=A0A1H2E2Y7_9GAMM|nr:uroporphyrinogen-III C-methyltransferase [Halopseudomonas salegens]SDT89404.1 uroporphyrin-3 C-methyltransferase [Halopseudomonas salegens]
MESSDKNKDAAATPAAADAKPAVETGKTAGAADQPGTEPAAAGTASTTSAKPGPAEEKVSVSTQKSGSGGGEKPPARPDSGAAGGGGRGLGMLALLLALLALALTGWQWWQQQSASSTAGWESAIQELASQQEQTQQALNRDVQDLARRSELEQLQRLAADLQRSQQNLGQRLDALQGEEGDHWQLAEAQYLLRLASLRLIASDDVETAGQLLAVVDDILKQQPDSGVFSLRERLAQYQAELAGLGVVDRPGIYVRLGALREQVNRLVALPVPVFDPDEVTVEEEYADRLERRTRWERVLMRLERYVRVDFQRGKVITPLLDDAEMQRIRRTLQLTLEQAQWAALRGEEQVFQASLEQADSILRQFFELDNSLVQAMQSQLQTLAEEPVSLSPPDLSDLEQALAAYITQRTERDNGAEPEEAP